MSEDLYIQNNELRLKLEDKKTIIGLIVMSSILTLIASITIVNTLVASPLLLTACAILLGIFLIVFNKTS